MEVTKSNTMTPSEIRRSYFQELWNHIHGTANLSRNSKSRAKKWVEFVRDADIPVTKLPDVLAKNDYGTVSISFNYLNRQWVVDFDEIGSSNFFIKKTPTNWDGWHIEIPQTKEELLSVWNKLTDE